MFKALLLRMILAAFACAALTLAQPTETIIDVRNGDQKGKLAIRETELAFESLTDAKQSRTWKYADIRTFEKRIIKGLRVRPFKGSRYDFSFDSIGTRDNIFKQISDRIVEARRGKK